MRGNKLIRFPINSFGYIERPLMLEPANPVRARPLMTFYLNTLARMLKGKPHFALVEQSIKIRESTGEPTPTPVVD